MKKVAIIGLIALMVLSFLFTGCESMKNANNTQKGAGIGAASGAIIGGIIGRNTGNAALGAAIGAVVGGGTGALIGNEMDKQAREIDQALPDRVHC